MEAITFHIDKPKKLAFPMIRSAFEKEVGLVSVQMKRLRSEINDFEQKYAMSSKEFYKKFEDGELGDKQDFFLWASSLDIYRKLNEEYLLLKGLAEQCRT